MLKPFFRLLKKVELTTASTLPIISNWQRARNCVASFLQDRAGRSSQSLIINPGRLIRFSKDSFYQTEAKGTRRYRAFVSIAGNAAVRLAFIAKALGAFQAIVFAKDANEQTFRLGFLPGLARAPRLDVDHLSAPIAINRIFNHQNLLYPENAVDR